jgi:hypothetical protein
MMTLRMRCAAAVLATGLLFTGVTGAAAGPENGSPNNCFGQHVSDMAQKHGGMAAATGHHNDMHGTNLSVGEHMAMMREHGCHLMGD